MYFTVQQPTVIGHVLLFSLFCYVGGWDDRRVDYSNASAIQAYEQELSSLQAEFLIWMHILYKETWLGFGMDSVVKMTVGLCIWDGIVAIAYAPYHCWSNILRKHFFCSGCYNWPDLGYPWEFCIFYTDSEKNKLLKTTCILPVCKTLSLGGIVHVRMKIDKVFNHLTC